MRQNPMLQPRVPAGGRSMPAWFSTTLVQQSRITQPSPPPPPLPVEPPPDESDYEEIDHIPKNAMKKPNGRRTCSLCGNPNPAVSCEMCSNQIFCGSCNDMYHRHPKRQHHSRKILEPLLDNRPPLPPKTPIPPEMMQAQLPPLPPTHFRYPSPPHGPPPMHNAVVPTPQPPPRRKGRFGMRSAAGSPTTAGGIKSFFDPVGTLKKFMGGMAHRPLPAPPKPPPPLPPKPADLGRAMTPTFRGPMGMIGDRRLNSPQPGAFPQDERRQIMPMNAVEVQNARMHSMSVANLSGHTTGRDSGYPDWEEDDETDFFTRNRAQSVSGGVLGRFPSTSHDASHFATLHRPGRNQRQPNTQTSTTSLVTPPQNSSAPGGDHPPERPPPPLPPRQFPSQTQLNFQTSQSVFDLDRMAAVTQQQSAAAAAFGMQPWNYPMAPGYPFDFQQAMMMGYPGGGTMHRTPSTQSMGPSINASSNQQPAFFGWGPMGFGPPMTQMEMDMMTRRGSEQFMNLLPQQQQQMSSQQRSVPLSNPVTPQGSFRKKAGRHMSVEPELTRRIENRSNLDIGQNRRSGTPSSFVRVPQPPSSTASTPAPLASSSSAFASAQKPTKPPAKPPSNPDHSPDDSYFSAERQQLTESSESTAEVTENPEGPWECEHCTFINPKSTKVCTICCKTPSAGYKGMKGKRSILGSGKSRFSKKSSVEQTAPLPISAMSGSGRRRDSSRESASSTGGTDEIVPVLKSKLSISRDQKQQQTKINLVSKVEKERVKKSSLKAGTSGTLKAGMAPPGVKAAAVGAKRKTVKKTKSKVVSDDSDDDVEEEEEDDDEELIAEPDDDEEEEPEEEDESDSGEKAEEEDDEEEVENFRQQKSDDENADDEENGVVNVKINASSSKMHTGRAAKIASKKGSLASAPKGKTGGARVRSSSRSSTASQGQTRKLADSNEDVYGSVPIQTLQISPKIDIKRPGKSKVSTGVGTSPPKSAVESGKCTKSSSTVSSVGATAFDNGAQTVSEFTTAKRTPTDSLVSAPGQNEGGLELLLEKESSQVSGEISPVPNPTVAKRKLENEINVDVTPAMTADNSEMSTVTVAISSTSVSSGKKKAGKKANVSTGTQSEDGNVKDKKLSNGGTDASTVISNEIGSSSSFPVGKEEMKDKKKAEEVVQVVENRDSGKTEKKENRKSSVGTSPPPQSISTQTYEDAPSLASGDSGGGGAAADDASSLGGVATKSSSKTSLLKSDNEQYYEPRHNIEMSEKAVMRYARKVRNKEQHFQKLKRSMSTQLTYPGEEPWMDAVEGRHLYRSSSRQSLASDTRSLPMSGPPSRDNSPPPMGRYGGMGGERANSRGGWYDEFRRYPPPSSMWDFRYGMPPDNFMASIDDLMGRRGRRESMRSQEFELTRMLKDAEEYNFSPEDVQVGIRMCGDKNPIKWLQENWSSMIETVQTLATKYGREKGADNNDVGTISHEEAKDAIRTNRGNVWAAVTECVDQRRKKFQELESRGTFLREDILTALTAHHGNLEAAYVELSKAQLQPFLMRIWGQSPATTETEQNIQPQEPAISLERSFSNPGPSTQDAPKSSKKTRKTSLGTAPKPATPVADIIEQQAPPKQLETLVSNAEKVSQQIEKAIQELKRTGGVVTTTTQQVEETFVDQELPVQSLELIESPIAIQKDESKDSIHTADDGEATRLKSESESDHSAVHHFVKSDDGEDESFVDAVSESASMANSPPPLPQFPPQPEEDEEILAEAANIIINEALLANPTEINNNTINVNYEDDVEDDEEEFEEDVLEIEIDDTEANISEFIQNYEIPPANEHQEMQERKDEEDEEEKEIEPTEEEDLEEEDDPVEEEMEEVQSGVGEGTGDDKGVTKGEIEKLMTALTSTFSEMEQFAFKIKENIASEIQQQLAAAANANKKSGSSSTSHDHSEDGSYEPIALPPGIEENVNKKVAKYQRLAAKKKEKVARHKSPETRAFLHGDENEKEPSVSPLPSTSGVSEATVETTEEMPKKKRGKKSKSQQQQVEEESKEKDILGESGKEKDTAEVEEDGEVERASTAQSRFSDYEEVEIGQEDQQQANEEGEEEVVVEEDGGFVVDGEEEDANVESSSVLEESEKEILIEDEDEQEDVEEGDEDNGGGDIYANVQINTEGLSITPSDTDKVIIAGGNTNMTTAAKTLRKNNSGATEESKSVVIVAEDLSGNQGEKTEIETEPAPGQVEKEETPAERLIKEGKTDNLAQAELALHLLEMNFSEDDALSAAKECSSLCSALSYLQQECDLCTGKFSAREMVSMIHCTHLCCRSCARDYFTVQVRDKTIVDATCPFCAEPTALTDDAELATEYFNHLDILLKNLLDSKHHEMFQRKLRDWTLAKTPNFKWCSKCSSGFITEPLQTRLVCPDCRAVTCAVCMEPWDKVNHDHRDDSSNTVKLCDIAPKSIIEYLNANHIECPRCHFRFSLARGGCMHLTCTQCHHEFCSGCAAPFRMGDKCEAKYPICDKLGLHAHHPRNCLFYLRDKEPDVLSKLLEENAIPYFKENSGEEQTAQENAAEGEDGNKAKVGQRVCQVPIQKETSDGYMDDICGKEAPEGYATVCKIHYIEYLGLLIWQNHLDPITILTNDDLEVIVRRAFKKHPGRPNWLSDELFRKRLLKVINDEIPL